MSPREAASAWWSSREAKKRTLKIALGLVLGGLAGFAYYSQVGCATGACPITSNPYISVAWGAGIGGLLGMS
jgi:hypothetical protein